MVLDSERGCRQVRSAGTGWAGLVVWTVKQDASALSCRRLRSDRRSLLVGTACSCMCSSDRTRTGCRQRLTDAALREQDALSVRRSCSLRPRDVSASEIRAKMIFFVYCARKLVVALRARPRVEPCRRAVTANPLQ